MSIRSRYWAYAAAAFIAIFPTSNAARALDGNPEHGKELYEVCSACHAPTTNKVGPRHCGILDQPAASVADFSYSDAMRESGIVWDDEHLNEFLKSPFTYVSGTKMGFVGYDDEQDRADIIAYMREFSINPDVCCSAD